MSSNWSLSLLRPALLIKTVKLSRLWTRHWTIICLKAMMCLQICLSTTCGQRFISTVQLLTSHLSRREHSTAWLTSKERSLSPPQSWLNCTKSDTSCAWTAEPACLKSSRTSFPRISWTSPPLITLFTTSKPALTKWFSKKSRANCYACASTSKNTWM